MKKNQEEMKLWFDYSRLIGHLIVKEEMAVRLYESTRKKFWFHQLESIFCLYSSFEIKAH